MRSAAGEPLLLQFNLLKAIGVRGDYQEENLKNKGAGLSGCTTG